MNRKKFLAKNFIAFEFEDRVQHKQWYESQKSL